MALKTELFMCGYYAPQLWDEHHQMGCFCSRRLSRLREGSSCLSVLLSVIILHAAQPCRSIIRTGPVVVQWTLLSNYGLSLGEFSRQSCHGPTVAGLAGDNLEYFIQMRGRHGGTV